MAHYIDKDALVAEIDQRLHQLTDAAFDSVIGRNLIEIKKFINTLEVKEVDLEDKIYDYINAHYSEGCDGGMISDAHNNIGGVTYLDLTTIAKHFFELGMAASNKVQKG